MPPQGQPDITITLMSPHVVGDNHCNSPRCHQRPPPPPHPNPSVPHCHPGVTPVSPGRAIDDKYSRREEFRGFTQDFKEKEGYRPEVKIEYVDETGRKLTPKEVTLGDSGGQREGHPAAPDRAPPRPRLSGSCPTASTGRARGR